MKLNPYETATQTQVQPSTRRAARRYRDGALIMAALGVIVALPGAVLLNQDWQLVPTSMEFTHVEYDRRFISSASITRVSLMFGAAC